MSFDLEKELLQGIPLDEAAGFFTSLLPDRQKVASAEELAAAYELLEPEEKLEVAKLAAGTPFLEHVQPGTEGYYSARMLAVLQQLPAHTFLDKEANAAQLPPASQGMTMSPVAPTALPATAQGQNPVKMATAEDVGRERAHTQISTSHEKHRHSGGERVGKHLGTLLGAAGGAAAGHKAGGHGALGAAMGAIAGRSLGKDVGKSHDVSSFHEKMKHAAARMKIAFGDEMSMSSEAGLGNTPDIHQYLASEELGADAEEANAAQYYRQKFEAASQQLQQVQEQAEQTQTMTDSLSQQVAGSQEQIQAAMQQAQMASQAAMQNVQQAHEMAMGATQQAMESQQEVLRQKQLAAAMKMGITQVKDQVMSALAADPTDQLAQQLTAPPPGSGGVVGGGAPPGQDPNAAAMQNPSEQAAGNPADPNAAQAGAGAPGQSPGGGTAPNSAGASDEAGEGASDGKSEKSESSKTEKKDPEATTKVEVKQGSAKLAFPLSVPHALGGAALGAGVGAAYAKSSNEPLKKKVNQLSGVENRSFGQALDLAQSKARLALGEAAEEHPVATTIGSALHGAALGATAGPEMTQSLGNIGKNFREAFQNLKATG